jgi:hypothetical protein
MEFWNTGKWFSGNMHPMQNNKINSTLASQASLAQAKL